MAEAKVKVSDENLAEAEALKQLFEEHKGRLNLSHRSLAADYGVSQGAISGYFNAYTPLNLKVAAFLASKLKVPISAFSERLAAEADMIFELLSASPSQVSKSAVDRSSLRLRAQTAALNLTQAVFDNQLFEPEVQAMEDIVKRATSRGV
jgi:transcriptional regulator with XRE-family HTH domain